MKSDLFSGKLHTATLPNKELLLSVLAFLLGTVTYILLKPSLDVSADHALSIVHLDYRLFGCVFALIVIQLSAFSVIGSVIIPLADWFAGLFLPMTLASIIPFADIGLTIILKLFFCSLVIIYFTVFLSSDAICSARRIYTRLKSDKRLKAEFAKAVVLACIFVTLSIIGITDINTLF